MADLFADRGFFENRTATIGWDEYRSFTWAAGTVLTDLNPIRRDGVPLGYDTAGCTPCCRPPPVSDATTSVQYLRQTTPDARRHRRDQAARRDHYQARDVDHGRARVAAAQPDRVRSSGIPRIHAAQPMFQSLVEQDLRLSINDGLDELVRRGVVHSAGTIVAGAGRHPRRSLARR